jgi:hypothetical protein
MHALAIESLLTVIVATHPCLAPPRICSRNICSLLNHLSSCEGLNCLQSEGICVEPLFAVDTWGEAWPLLGGTTTKPLLGVMGYWVDIHFVLKGKVLTSLPRGRAAKE